jgi:hypothetical protein
MSRTKFNKNNVCKTLPQTPWYWSPLLESNNFGYFTRQEHVTPHCGFTGRLYGLTPEEYESFSSPQPSYNYCAEADFVLEQTKNMNDQKKMEIELFDSKFTSLLPLQINWSIRSGFSLFDFWFYDMSRKSVADTCLCMHSLCDVSELTLSVSLASCHCHVRRHSVGVA